MIGGLDDVVDNDLMSPVCEWIFQVQKGRPEPVEPRALTSDERARVCDASDVGAGAAFCRPVADADRPENRVVERHQFQNARGRLNPT